MTYSIQCNRREDLKNLCLVSKALHLAAIPRLYRSLALLARDEANISDLTIGSLLGPSRQRLKHTREIILIADFHKLLRHRCYDHDSSSDDETDTDNWSSSSNESDTDHLPRESGEVRTGGGDHPDNESQIPLDAISQITEWGDRFTDTLLNEGLYPGSLSREYNGLMMQDLTPHGQFIKALESSIQPLLDLLPEAKLERFRYDFY